MEESRIRSMKLKDSGFSQIMPLLHGAHRLSVLFALMEYGTVRFNELKGYIDHISYKTLSIALKDLTEADLIWRVQYPQGQPRVEYGLTDKGRTLVPVLVAMRAWGDQQLKLPPDERVLFP